MFVCLKLAEATTGSLGPQQCALFDNFGLHGWLSFSSAWSL